MYCESPRAERAIEFHSTGYAAVSPTKQSETEQRSRWPSCLIDSYVRDGGLACRKMASDDEPVLADLLDQKAAEEFCEMLTTFRPAGDGTLWSRRRHSYLRLDLPASWAENEIGLTGRHRHERFEQIGNDAKFCDRKAVCDAVVGCHIPFCVCLLKNNDT